MLLILTLFGRTIATLTIRHTTDWHLSHAGLCDLLQRAHDGEDPQMLLVEAWANTGS